MSKHTLHQFVSEQFFPGILHVTLFSLDSLTFQHPKSSPDKCSTVQKQKQDAKKIHIQPIENEECDG